MVLRLIGLVLLGGLFFVGGTPTTKAISCPAPQISRSGTQKIIFHHQYRYQTIYVRNVPATNCGNLNATLSPNINFVQGNYSVVGPTTHSGIVPGDTVAFLIYYSGPNNNKLTNSNSAASISTTRYDLSAGFAGSNSYTLNLSADMR